MSQQPPRRGHGQPSRHPTRVGDPVKGSNAPRSGKANRADQAPRQGVVSVKQLSAFFTALPPWGVAQFARNYSRIWDPTVLVRGAREEVDGQYVPEGMVYILTDIIFYVFAPSSGIAAAPRRLNHGELGEMVRFDLKIGSGKPMAIEGTGRAVVGGVPMYDFTNKEGWPFPDDDFGPRRSTGSAVYAMEGQQIKSTIFIQAVPPFRLISYGVEMHGVQVQRELLDQIWRRG